jgi:FixJ family two-component response regulator
MTQGSPTVIVVDDDEGVCRALDRLLRSAGYPVKTFTSPTEFLTRLPEDGPGCLVLDVSMPGLNGLQLQQHLTELGRAWPILFVTGQGDIPTSVRAMKAGAVDFLTKPVDDQALLNAIAQALAQDGAARAERNARHELEARVATLTPREYEVFCLVVTGLLNKQIAAQLGTTEKTIKVHRGRVMEKLAVESLAGLVHIADSLGIQGPVAREDVVPASPRPSRVRSASATPGTVRSSRCPT